MADRSVAALRAWETRRANVRRAKRRTAALKAWVTIRRRKAESAAQALAEKHRGRKGVFSAQERKDYLRSIWNVPPYTSLEAIAAACEKEFGERVNVNMVRGEGYNRLRLPSLRKIIGFG